MDIEGNRAAVRSIVRVEKHGNQWRGVFVAQQIPREKHWIRRQRKEDPKLSFLGIPHKGTTQKMYIQADGEGKACLYVSRRMQKEYKVNSVELNFKRQVKEHFKKFHRDNVDRHR